MKRTPWGMVFMPTGATLHVDQFFAKKEHAFRFISFDECDAIIKGLPVPPANARILESRNKREGWYCGRVESGYRWTVGPSGHQRAGGGPIKQTTLRQWSRA